MDQLSEKKILARAWMLSLSFVALDIAVGKVLVPTPLCLGGTILYHVSLVKKHDERPSDAQKLARKVKKYL